MGTIWRGWKILLPRPTTTMAMKLHTSARLLSAAALAASCSSVNTSEASESRRFLMAASLSLS